ncbi:MAG: N(2)-fixation sustaining protein CowN [Aeromonadaceae bacterium]
MSHCKCHNQATDRYVSFEGIDCDGNARQLMAMIYHHIEQPERNNAFWDYFRQKASGGSGPKPDDLFMIHCHLNQIRELFEQWQDQEALTLLDRVEIECC